MSLPPSEVPQGAIRFNTDSQKLEFYAQGEWWNMVTDTPNLGQGTDSTPGARGLIGGGYDSPNFRDIIDYINISSTGNAIDFGDLTTPTSTLYGASSNTRAVFAGGQIPSGTNVMEYVTIASTGDAVTFGEKTTKSNNNSGGCSNQTRGVFNGGHTPAPFTPIDTIDYITIASTGNAVDFGNLSGGNSTQQSGIASPTRGIFAGGYAPGTGHNDAIIEFVNIATTGDTQDFGECTAVQNLRMGGCANATRGLFGGGQPRSSQAIDLIIMTSAGNAIDFGDLSSGRVFLTATSSPTRGVFAGGSGPSGYSGYDVIDYVIFATQGNAVDFGNLSPSGSRGRSKGLSNAHGGL